MTRHGSIGSLAIAAIAATFLWSAPTEATLISDVQSIGFTLDAAHPTYSSLTYGTSFNLTDDGVPGSATVEWARVTFTMLDVDGSEDAVTAILGPQTLYGAPDPLGFSVFGGMVSGSLVGQLNTSGLLSYTLNFFSGSSAVRIYDGSLVASVTSVPEPATLSLLGAGLLAGWLSRRRKVAA